MSILGNQNQQVKIAVIGDVHDQWEAADGEALRSLGVDLALFVGDFGNESVEVVQAIASLDIPKAVILGNHDAWYTATEWGRQRCPYDRAQEDWVQDQLDLLGEIHVGYGKLDFPEFNLTVVGGRPFSWGGEIWRNADFYRERYGVMDFAHSTERIVAAVNKAAYNTIIFLGHNGPVGLGDRPEDPCGKDWEPLGGDFGDSDLANAIAQTKKLGKSVPLVTFGHMHHHLRHRKDRLRTQISTSNDGTVYLNSASVPRIIHKGSHTERNFSLVTLQAGVVMQASLVWVGKEHSVISEQILYQVSQNQAQTAYSQL
ncbi:TIGR04168 family protein [[Phormidium ambiguum] IAM M-71]|uniref:TIGR04168 family protein n=1 Tax=[Phormidium ambiguum] IAM M-71 TaxID=454136 RepID=A0A1U7ISH9_9CYAN|nr:TIGR04168 family protein [Phormidium ambiguum]OKH40461.1 TIGR04168 family protein [Phormidium ambiguum IAM M-71]